jgi:hypothetical protein
MFNSNTMFTTTRTATTLPLLFLFLLVVTIVVKPSDGVYGPLDVGERDRFWKHLNTERQLIHDGVNHYQNIESCLQTTMGTDGWEQVASAKSTTRRAGKMLEDQAYGNVMLVVVENAIHPVHVKAVQALASCVRTYLPHLYESRAMYQEMDLDEDDGSGGNCPTHLVCYNTFVIVLYFGRSYVIS